MSKQKAAETRPEEEVFVYIGPAVQGVAQPGMICAGSREEVLARFAPILEKCPEAARLVVKDTELAEARRKLKQGGNAVSQAAERLASALRK